MASGPNLTPRGYSITTNPEQFRSQRKLFIKTTDQVRKVFDNYTNSTGSTQYSEPITLNISEGFTVYADTSGNILVQHCEDPKFGIWETINTISSDGFYTNKTAQSWVRIGIANTVTATVWVYRKYSSY